MNDVIGKIRIKKEDLEENVTFELIPATEWSEGHKRVDCDLARGFIPFDIKRDVDEEVIKKLLSSVAHATLEEKVNFLDGEMTGLTFEEIGLSNPVGEDEEGKEEIKEVETFLNVLCEDVFIEDVRSVKESLMKWAIQFFGIEFVPLSDDGELDSDDDSDDPSTIEFEVISKLIESVTIRGYVYVDEVDDESPLHFYDHQGLECGSYVPSNPFEEGTDDWEAYEELSSAFQSDERFMQFLADFSDENVTVDRGDYFLKINHGAKMELEITSIWDCPEFEGNHPLHQYWAKVVVKFNGKNIMDYPAPSYYYNGWDDLLNAMQEIYDFDKGYIQNKAFWMEMPKGIYEWCEESYMQELAEETIEEYVDVCREYFAQALTSALDVASIDETLEQEMDTNADDSDLFIMDYFTGKSEDEFKSYLVEQGYEF